MILMSLLIDVDYDPWDIDAFEGGDGTEGWMHRACAWIVKLEDEGLSDVVQNVALTDLLLRLAERMDALELRYSH
jgi:hypothetical protein